MPVVMSPERWDEGSTRYYWDIRLAGLTVFIAAQTVILATAIF